jgi:two-component system, cell cycle sensor histidine kinase and response regulator CckA
VAAATPSEALSIARSHSSPIDILLTDVHLPECTGPALADGIRGICPGVRVVLMSGDRTPPLAAYDAFVGKPIELETLLQVIDRLRPV